ncbi:hypothetical protein ACH5RR_037647 [Cinchona calisaya]|uniref:SBP-type domain-containing protein n=1 Tax=Cinchona calisaya TaxID=153742 RepID=A0ABD2Y838_9GENT
MEPHMHHNRQSSSATKKEKEKTDIEEEEEEEEEEGGGGGGGSEDIEEESEFKKIRMNLVEVSEKRGSSSRTSGAGAGAGAGAGGGVVVARPPSCRAEKCKADLTNSKSYYMRHKVCEYHAKAEVVILEGLKQRFCQQCSRFHELPEFDEAKRSCRRRLAGHNKRRRKHISEPRGEGSLGRRGSNPGIKKDQCRQVDERGRTPMVLSENQHNLHIH